jgi:uncharacterized protein (TIGR03435 family)
MTRSVVALLLLASCAWGQSFEVVSIRRHVTQIESVGVVVSGQRFTAEAISLDNLITYAYDMKKYQVVGLPSWGDSNNSNCDRYDVAAKAEGDGTLSRDQARMMLQTMLADRFNLRFHREIKEAPIYALVAAKDGPKLKENSSDAESLLRVSFGSKGVELTSTKSSIAQLVAQLTNSNGVDRPVIDRTELNGNYDYKLTWTPGFGGAGNDSEAVSVFTALQEQLGLRLDPQKGPVEVVIIDHAEKPSEN